MKLLRTVLTFSILAPIAWAADSQALAAKLLELSGTRNAMEQSFELGFKPVFAQMKAHGLPDELINNIHDEANKFFAENFKWEEVEPTLAKMYSDAFTESELNDMVKFYESPTGKKAAAMMPQLTQQSTTFALSRVQKQIPEFQRKVAGMVEEYRRKSAPPMPAPTTSAPGPTLPAPSPTP